jgi:hypothetical protein
LDHQGRHFQDRLHSHMSVILPAFHQGKDISWNMYVDEFDARLNSYDMIIGRDLLHELGVDLLFSLGVMKGTTQLSQREIPLN